MAMEPHRCHCVIAVAVATAAIWAQLAATGASQQPAGDGGPATHGLYRQLPSLQRMVHHFDFEEAEHAPYEMPLNFYRYGAEDGAAAQGFPPFGSMRLTNEVAYSGNWSFEFSLDGGSLAARVPTAVLPVVPLADYAVTAQVRTEGLTAARARLVAWLHDAQGRAIEASRTVSDLIETGGEWQTHSIHVRGDFEDAADMVIELQLLQPRQFTVRGGDPSMVLDDIRGSAWFDDVTMWHLPRIDISTDHPGNAIVMTTDSAAAPTLTILVRDLAHEDLYARLRIFDIDGAKVHDERFAAPRMPRPRTVNLPSLRYGWYRAVLDLTSGRDSEEIIAMQWVDFALLAPPSRPATRPDPRFGVALGDEWAQHADDIPAIIQRLGAGSVVVPMWTASSSGPISQAVRERMRRAMTRFVAHRLHLTMAVESVPAALAQALDVSTDDVLGAFARHGQHKTAWRDVLDPLIAVGVDVHHWQLGSTEVAGPFEQANLQRLIDAASQAVRQLASAPTVAVPFSAEQRVDTRLDVAARSIDVPHELLPDTIGEYAEYWARHPSPYQITLRQAPPMPNGDYTQRERVLDLFHRAIHAIRAGVGQMNIVAPWVYEDRRCSIDPTFILWRQLTDHLHERTFVGEMQLGDSRQCWLFQGERPGDHVLVAWSRRLDGDDLVMQLADDEVHVVDIFGNAETIGLTGHSPGEHRIHLTRVPVFIEGVNLPLVQFRGSFALDEMFIPAEHRTHERAFILRNPWPIPLAGTLHIEEKPQWRISPRSHEFNIPPGGEVRLPVEITFERSTPAGESTINAEATLQADGTYRLALSAPVRVGLPHLELSSAWRVVTNAETGRNDLVIIQYITHTGPPDGDPVYADAIVMAPGVRQERRLIAGLEPGQMAMRMFQIPDGAVLLAGQTVRVSVADRNSLGRINHELHIPSLRRRLETAGVQSGGTPE